MAFRSTNSSHDSVIKSTASDDSDASQAAEDRKAGSGTPGGPKIRSRAIDVNQPLVVMFPQDDTAFDGYFVHVEGFASTERPKVLRGSQVNVPIPVFQLTKEAQAGQDPPTFSRPKHYIREHIVPPTELNEKVVEYDLDDDDDAFIRALNATEARKKKKPLSEELFEAVIDFLEKESFFRRLDTLGTMIDRRGHVVFNPEDLPCSVCWNSSSGEADKLVTCGGCQVAVHPACYGMRSIGLGDWKCDKCKLPDRKQINAVECSLCPSKAGALRPQDDGRWYHLACMHACPVTFQRLLSKPKQSARGATPATPTRSGRPKGKSAKEQMKELPDPPGERWGATCCFCSKSRGVCVVCCEDGCKTTFHTTCAQKWGLFIKRIDQGKSNEKSKRGTQIYCRRHSLKPEFLARKNLVFLPKSIQDAEVECLNRLLSQSKRVPPVEPDVALLIFRFWLMKRYTEAYPLLPRLVSLTKDRAEVEELWEKYQTNRRKYDSLVALRQRFERIRILVDLCRKRDILKRQYMDSVVEVFEGAFGSGLKPSLASPSGDNKKARVGRPMGATPVNLKRQSPNEDIDGDGDKAAISSPKRLKSAASKPKPRNLMKALNASAPSPSGASPAKSPQLENGSPAKKTKKRKRSSIEPGDANTPSKKRATGSGASPLPSPAQNLRYRFSKALPGGRVK